MADGRRWSIVVFDPMQNKRASTPHAGQFCHVATHCQVDRFLPERWSKEAVQERKGTERAIVDHRLFATPFSAGARMCLGARAADWEIKALTTRLVQDWKIELDPPGQAWKAEQQLMLKAMPFPKFKLTRRTRGSS